MTNFQTGPQAAPAQDHRVREAAQLRLTLRSDLRFTPHYEAGEQCYLIEDPARSQFFRVGISEYLFISMFDGSTSVGDALLRIAQVQGDHALTEVEATAICKWLVDSDLASTPESSGSERLAKNAADRAIQKRLGAWNPLCMKVPLAYPDRLFARITPWLRHFFGPLALLAGLVVAWLAIGEIISSWDQFAAASRGIFSPGRWIWMAVCWLILKVVHESAHGIVCRKYGGSVHEAGAIFVLFAPLAYVDLTSSWRFRSKWQRIYTAAAGIYVELWIASVAAIAWSYTSPGLLNDLCFNIVLMASLSTILFNANPLMRFDGYYMLSDSLEIPNLYGDGQQYLRYLGRRYILGEKVHSPLRWSIREIFTRVYGAAALVWRVFICFSLVVAAAMLFDGLGVVIAAIAVMLWVGVPMFRLVKYTCRRDGLHRRRQTRLAIAGLIAGVLGFFILGLPWPGATPAAAIVGYEPLTFVRASSPGFVQMIYVQSGEQVEAGEPIALLDNPQLLAELRDLDLAIALSLLKSRVYKQTDEIHSYQAEMEQLRSLQQKRGQKQQQVDDLTLRAPAPGRIVARGLPWKLGTYLHQGDTLAAIGDETRKELQIAITQSDFDRFKSQLGRTLDARISGGIVLRSQLERVDPRATTQAPHESMYAALGGSLESRAVEGDEQGGQFELLSPHFTGFSTLTRSQSEALRVGQRGVVWLGRNHRTFGSYLQQKIRTVLPQQLRWVEDAFCWHPSLRSTS